MFRTQSRKNGWMDLDKLKNKNSLFPGLTFRLLFIPENVKVRVV